MSESDEWVKAIIRNFEAGHYRRVLLMLAYNEVDNGNVKYMIRDMCKGVEPLADWRNFIKRG